MSTIKTYNKLVRDRIPDIIESNGGSCEIVSLDRQDYILALDEKLKEELTEFQESRDAEELADMLEVIFAMAKAQGYSWLDVVGIQREKREKRGGFDRGVFLKTVEEK